MTFDGSQAYNQLVAQMSIGPRPAGSPGDRATGDYILAQLNAAHWQTEAQEFRYQNVPLRNIIGKLGAGRGPLIILGAHYDTRPVADRDPVHPNEPMPGANDGASGTAVLLELARALDPSRLHNKVWLAFLDAEDNGGLDTCALVSAGKTTDASAAPCDKTTWPYSVGATYLATHLEERPTAVVILDMIGDADQQIYYEQNSNVEVKQAIWNVAARLGYGKFFIPKDNYSIEDDHTPFLQQNLAAVDLIDFDYPYWHTTQDTADKCSPSSLERVGRTLQAWLYGQ